mmetsp:Transcript_7514/g.21024  ORF Transcript_7514/g.21024 Transcript_7514/m.21024 type:complete len:210 (-) Transcript_7514:149-778(-)
MLGHHFLERRRSRSHLEGPRSRRQAPRRRRGRLQGPGLPGAGPPRHGVRRRLRGGVRAGRHGHAAPQGRRLVRRPVRVAPRRSRGSVWRLRVDGLLLCPPPRGHRRERLCCRGRPGQERDSGLPCTRELADARRQEVAAPGGWRWRGRRGRPCGWPGRRLQDRDHPLHLRHRPWRGVRQGHRPSVPQRRLRQQLRALLHAGLLRRGCTR